MTTAKVAIFATSLSSKSVERQCFSQFWCMNMHAATYILRPEVIIILLQSNRRWYVVSGICIKTTQTRLGRPARKTYHCAIIPNQFFFCTNYFLEFALSLSRNARAGKMILRYRHHDRYYHTCPSITPFKFINGPLLERWDESPTRYFTASILQPRKFMLQKENHWNL